MSRICQSRPPVAGASATPSQTGGCLKTLKKVAIVAAVIIGLAAVVTLATYSWPAAVAVVGIVGIVALITYIYRKCHGTSKISPVLIHNRAAWVYSGASAAALPLESVSTIGLRSWYEAQIRVRQPWNEKISYETHMADLNQAQAMQDLARCIEMDNLVTTTISYADAPISFSEEIIRSIRAEASSVSEGNIKKLFQDIKQKLTTYLPAEFSGLAEEMLLIASRGGVISDAWEAENARIASYKADNTDLESLFLAIPEPAAGNRQILFSQSGDTVTITVKSKTTLTAIVDDGVPERVGDVYLVSEFTYKKVENSNPFASPFIKSYHYRTEYVKHFSGADGAKFVLRPLP